MIINFMLDMSIIWKIVVKGPVYFGITYAYISIMKEASLVQDISENAVTQFASYKRVCELF